MAARKEDTFENLLEAMSVLSFEIGSHFYAKPTYIIDPHNFYLIPFPFLYHLAYLSKPGNPIQSKDLKENCIVIFKSLNPEVNKYFKIVLDEHIRGVIQSIGEDNKCQIYALDRGFIEHDVSADRIFHTASKEALNTPGLIQCCELDSCAPIGLNFSDESIDAFKFYIGNEKLSIVVRGKSVHKLRITVYNSNPDDVASLLALTHYTYLCSTVRQNGKTMTLEFPSQPKLTYQHIVLNIGEILNVRVQSGTALNSFYVTPISAYKRYLKNRADFTNFCKSVPEIGTKEFSSGTVVGVQDDASFYYERAVILEIIDPEKAKVKLVDWGTEVEVPRSRIKALKTEFFLSWPAYALFCAAEDGFVPWDNGLSNFLYKGYTFTMKVQKVGREFETPHIVALAQT